MEFSFEPSQAKTPRGRLNRVGTTSTPASDRLQKAIERNRAKQAKRQAAPSSTADRATRSTIVEKPSRQALRDRLNKACAVEQQRDLSSEVIVVPKKTVSRRNVAVAGRASFNEPLKKTSKVSAPVRYLGTNKTKQKKTAKGDSRFIDHLVLVGWVTIAILTARLLFSERGIIDYYGQVDMLNKLYHEQQQVIEDNKTLVTEIKKIKSSSRYQKKIVRDHLGFIAQQEYLLLFAGSRQPSSTN